MFATYHANSPDADRRPWSVVRAERELEALEDAVAAAKTAIEVAVDALIVKLDQHASVSEAERRSLINVAHQGIDDLAGPAIRRLEDDL
jgi:hypothetical protein